MSNNIEWKAQGDANEYVLLNDGNWLAAIKMNGELMPKRQEEFVAKFSAATTLLAVLELAEHDLKCILATTPDKAAAQRAERHLSLISNTITKAKGGAQ